MQVVVRLSGLALGVGLAGVLCTLPVPLRAAESPLVSSVATTAPRPLASALDAARDGRWSQAYAIAERDGDVALDILRWLKLRNGLGTPVEVLEFLESNADWPGLDYMRRRSERSFGAATDAQVLTFFADYAPQTGEGALRYAAALEAAGRKGEAEATIVLAWRTLDLDPATHDKFRAQYVAQLVPHHEARLSHAIWENRDGDTLRMLDLVDDDHVGIARARMALQGKAGNIDALIDAVPEAMQSDPGLAYDRFAWRVQKGLRDDAQELLLEQSQIPNGLGFPEKWANKRRSYARDEMRNGSAEVAYKLASTHQLAEGSNFADLEWLAGYIALRFLKQPEVALKHFTRLQDAVQTPISLGRAGYWRGRAFEALEAPEKAMEAYRIGGEHQTSFYGLLAAEKAGIPFEASLAGQELGKPWQETALAENPLREAVALLQAAGEVFEAERFLKQLVATVTEDEIHSLGRMVEEFGDPHLEIMLGKAAASRGIVIPRHYYALHPMVEMKLPISMEMALAIARRESEFDPAVTSHVGARGLMQLMPRTAAAMARVVGDTDGVSDRLGYWAYNASLGSAYLAKLARDFDGNVMLMSVGYNAGPSRATRWSALFGDPRFDTVDAVDWVEHIPFRETRNYVQRVAESLPIYRARLGQPPLPIPFSQELSGSTLSAFAPEGE